MSSVPSVYPIMRNARRFTDQRLQSRAGISRLFATPFDQLAVHTIRRLNDKTSATFDRIVGAGTKLYLASNPTAIDTGYSGNPLSMVPFRPEQSPRPWMYVGDSNKMRKVLVNGTNYAMGIAPPLQAPQADMGVPAVTTIDDFNAVGSWVPGGTAGALSVINRSPFTALFFLLFDSNPAGGTNGTGWASISTGFGGAGGGFYATLLEGDRITVTQPGSSEIVEIQEVIPASFAQTGVTIAAIQYDSGTSGPCTITLNVPPTAVRANLGYETSMNQETTGQHIAYRAGTTNAVGMRRNSTVILQKAGGPNEVVRVLSVSSNQGGTISFRCSTQVTHIVGETVASIPSFRAYLANSYAIAAAGGGTFPVPSNATDVSQKALQSTIGAGTGTISEVTPLNLGIVAGQSVTIQEDDYIHLSFLIDNAANLSEVRLIFDVDSTTNDFQHTYYFKSFGPNDIQQALAGNTTMQEGRQSAYSGLVTNANIGATSGIKRRGSSFLLTASQANDPANTGGSTGTNIPRLTKATPIGQGRWMRLVCQVSDLTKVGTDSSATLQGVQGVRIQITVASQAVCAVASLWIGGCYGPDIGTTGAPYLYCHRGRSSVTGAKSLASPPTRSGIQPHRQIVIVNMLQHPDPQVDVLDVFRWGGSLPQWTYVGTTQNTANPQYQDVFDDTSIASSPQLETDTFQPFPTIDTPKKGTCNVTGTTVTQVSGDQFNTSWYQGSEIVINGIVYNLYAQPSSVTQMEIVQNGGTQTAVPFQINQATILGQPLSSFWGPYQQGTGLFCFACGDKFQPGVLFLTNGNDPDSASDVLQIEVTTPSEPLINGCMYNGQSYAFSSERLFNLYPSFGSGIVVESGTVLPAQGTNLFVPLEVPNGKGLYCQFCIAVGPKIWFRSRDGIYQTVGGEPQSITLGPLSLLFPHDDQPGQPVTVGTFTVYPPDDTLPNLQKLSYYNSFLYYDYQDTLGNKTTLVYNTQDGSWAKDDYTPTILCHYGEEGQGVNSLLLGGSDGRVYIAGGSNDGTGVAFPFEIRMPQMSELSGGYQHTRDGFLGLMNTAPTNLVVNVDGTDNSITLPSTAGAYKRFYTPLPALKGRLMAFALLGTSPFLGVFQRDCEFRAKTWADSDYTKINPFSSVGRAAEAKVG